jgi:hypothetical protein
MAVRLGIEVFGLDRVMVYQPQWLDQIKVFGEKGIVPLQRYLDAYGETAAKRMLWEGFGVISGGRAGYRLGEFTGKFPAGSLQGETCRGELLYAPHSHFDLDGRFIPSFCGGISLGDWHHYTDLRKSMQTGVYSERIAALIDSGPYGLYLLAEKQYGYSPRAAGYAGKCHLCVDVRRHLTAQDCFEEFQPPGFYDNLEGP